MNAYQFSEINLRFKLIKLLSGPLPLSTCLIELFTIGRVISIQRRLNPRIKTLGGGLA